MEQTFPTEVSEKVIKQLKPVCQNCTRDLIPAGPMEYHCNFEECKYWNINIQLVLVLKHGSGELEHAEYHKEHDPVTQHAEKPIPFSFADDNES